MRPRKLTVLAALAALALSLAYLARAAAVAHAAPGAGDTDLDDGDDDPDGDPGRDPDPERPPASGVRIAGPPIGEVLAAASRAAGLDRDPARGLIRRARVAGLVPMLTVRTGRNTSWQDLDPDVDRGTTIEVRATWRLDRLVFDGRELQVASLEAARRREQRRLASRVIRAYFHWQRAASAALESPRWALRAEEAAADLDSLTDGWFGDELARARRRPGARAPTPAAAASWPRPGRAPSGCRTSCRGRGADP
jgi:hypothetical protein